MKKQILSLVMTVLVCVGFAGFVAPKTALAADTIGVVNFPQIMTAHPDFSTARAALQLEERKAQQEFQSKAASLDDAGKAKLSQTLQERVGKRSNELLAPIEKKVLAAIKKVAKTEGVTVVLDVKSAVICDKDLTKDVIAALK